MTQQDAVAVVGARTAAGKKKATAGKAKPSNDAAGQQGKAKPVTAGPAEAAVAEALAPDAATATSNGAEPAAEPVPAEGGEETPTADGDIPGVSKEGASVEDAVDERLAGSDQAGEVAPAAGDAQDAPAVAAPAVAAEPAPSDPPSAAGAGKEAAAPPVESSSPAEPSAAVEAEAAPADTASVEPPRWSNGVAAAEPAEAAPGDCLTPAGMVQELSRRLSSSSLPPQQRAQLTTPTKPVPASKSPGGAAVPSGESSPPLSTHDTKNTINVSQLLKLGAFKKQPLQDFVPYVELQRLRLEDGIDATRKEDYLSDSEFKEVFGLDRDAWKKQPAWRQAQGKKKANLF